MENKNDLYVKFKEMFNDTVEIDNLLNCIDLKHLQVEDILFNYEKNRNRFGVIFMAKDNKTEKLQKIIIDAICGEPNSTQVKELTYDLGADCDKRIILYTLVNSDCTRNELWYEQEMMEGFSKVNNDCGYETLVARVALNSDKNYKYDLEIYPDEKKWTSFKKLPTKLEFEKAVFKVFYNNTDIFGGREDDSMDNIDEWFSGTCWYLEMNGISFMYPVWEENGLFVRAVSESHKGADDLKTIKDNNQKYLQRMFINRETTFEINFSGCVTMSIKLWSKPFSFFTKASPGDKKKIAEYLRQFDQTICEYWDYQHYLDGSRNDDVVEYLAIPEDAFHKLEKEIVS